MRIGLVGYGSMGRNHYRILSSLPGVELAAVCDPVQNDTGSVRHYSELSEMLSREHLDAAVVCVPTVQHHSVALELIDHGIHLLIEKPIAISEEEGREIAEAAAAQGIRAAVGHVERFNPVVTALIEELEGKTIYSIAITRVGPFPPRIKDVGVLVDLSVHDVDLIAFLTGGAEFAESRVFKSLKKNGDHEDNAVLAFRMENDVVASVITNCLRPSRNGRSRSQPIRRTTRRILSARSSLHTPRTSPTARMSYGSVAFRKASRFERSSRPSSHTS